MFFDAENGYGLCINFGKYYQVYRCLSTQKFLMDYQICNLHPGRGGVVLCASAKASIWREGGKLIINPDDGTERPLWADARFEDAFAVDGILHLCGTPFELVFVPLSDVWLDAGGVFTDDFCAECA